MNRICLFLWGKMGHAAAPRHRLGLCASGVCVFCLVWGLKGSAWPWTLETRVGIDADGRSQGGMAGGRAGPAARTSGVHIFLVGGKPAVLLLGDQYCFEKG